MIFFDRIFFKIAITLLSIKQLFSAQNAPTTDWRWGSAIGTVGRVYTASQLVGGCCSCPSPRTPSRQIAQVFLSS